MSKTHLTEQKFSDFALHPQIIEDLDKKGFHNCTPIQALALPFTLSGRDVAGQAQTGTGKTMAFLRSTLHHLLSHPAQEDRQINQPRALIIAPTRELAVQIHADAEPLAQATGLKLGLASAWVLNWDVVPLKGITTNSPSIPPHHQTHEVNKP